MFLELWGTETFVLCLGSLGHLRSPYDISGFFGCFRDMFAVRHIPSLAGIFDDAYNLAVEFGPAILVDPDQVLVSALPHCPTLSRFWRYTTIDSYPPALRPIFPRRAWPSWFDIEIGAYPTSFSITPVLRASPRWDDIAVITPGHAGDVYIYSGTTGAILRKLPCHLQSVISFDWSSTGSLLVTCGHDMWVYVTEQNSGRRVTGFEMPYPANGVAFVLDDTSVLLTTVQPSGRCGAFLVDLYGLEVHPLSFDRPELSEMSGRCQLWTSNDGSLAVIWCNYARAVHIADIRLRTVSLLCEVPGGLCGAGFLIGDRVLLVLATTIEIYDARTRAILSSTTVLEGRDSFLHGSVSRDGRIVGLCSGHYIYTWDTSTPIDEIDVLDDTGAFTAIVSCQGTHLYALYNTWRNPNRCRIIDIKRTHRDRTSPVPRLRSRIISTSVSSDMSTIGVAHVGPGNVSREDSVTVTTYRVADGATVFFILAPFLGFSQVSLSADGNQIILVYARRVELWTSSGCEETFLSTCFDLGNMPFYSASLSLDGSRLFVLAARAQESTTNLAVAVYDVQSLAPPILLSTAANQELNSYALERSRLVPIADTFDLAITCEGNDWERFVFLLRHRDWRAPGEGVSSVRVPLEEVDRIPGEQFVLQRDGWVTRYVDDNDAGAPVCWIPPSRRGNDLECYGHVLPLFTRWGELTAVDLSALRVDATSGSG
ncbi:hypothetical protein EXIGLDRAFT_262779 [Exidia glandulosa HHB12029]|uniref:YVTN repeat-like/Quino protein amine dehydrogenase n=1 Tax=Exidia glandulosa HHB12029 TaxID=1314781 RepID=A0A165DRZ0_EXIGL|nr:hypothetical protein EXIGLDRAFT_262779 [Exidia glandulosa HHB12029]